MHYFRVREAQESPFEKKSCYDCGHLESALSWWCVNEEAIKARGTSIPGCIHCPYWKPDWKMIDKKYTVYVSTPVYNYYRALKEAIRIEKKTGIKNWVELIIP